MSDYEMRSFNINDPDNFDGMLTAVGTCNPAEYSDEKIQEIKDILPGPAYSWLVTQISSPTEDPRILLIVGREHVLTALQEEQDQYENPGEATSVIHIMAGELTPPCDDGHWN